MQYEKKFQNQKTILTVSVAVVLLAVVLSVGFILGPSMVSNPNPGKTPPPSVTPTPLRGEPQFHDDGLVAAVQAQLGLDGIPTREDMEKLNELDCTQSAVESLVGLEYAINLKTLKIKLSATDIEPILELQLEKLTVVSDVSVQPLLDEICKLNYLKYLDLTDCGVSVVGYLSEMPVLETLILDNNRVSDLKNIQVMSTLKTLSLKNNNLWSVDELAFATSLEYLHVDNNRIKDVSKIMEMAGLKEFTYSGNLISEE